ncbi:Dna-J like membrane chaperone protein [Xylariales sp. PMI_506]|nr:Dna-J like membrane chaperone protein [Xylariales sp. PMI_506]
MPDATASGADTGGKGGARSREHNQGNQERKYTVEQKAAVLRIRRCGATAFYEILDIQKTCTDAEVKKAYRKQSLLTHPDKNGHEYADEAFKMVSRAFGILGDKEKREKFDRFGTDPDSRFESARNQNPFSGFGGRAASAGGGARPGGFGGGGMWEDEISPEEMFRQFFGGGFGGPFGNGGFGGFDTGPQFVFNLGGNRGFRVHQMGGGVPRRRPTEQQANGQRRETGGWENLVQLLPILFLFIFPLLTSLFSGGSSQPATPTMVFDTPAPPRTFSRTTSRHHVNYYVNPKEVEGWSEHKLKQLDHEAEASFVNLMRHRCQGEMRTKQNLHEQAQGWFFQDPDKMQIARDHPTPSCDRLQDLNIRRSL